MVTVQVSTPRLVRPNVIGLRETTSVRGFCPGTSGSLSIVRLPGAASLPQLYREVDGVWTNVTAPNVVNGSNHLDENLLMFQGTTQPPKTFVSETTSYTVPCHRGRNTYIGAVTVITNTGEQTSLGPKPVSSIHAGERPVTLTCRNGVDDH